MRYPHAALAVDEEASSRLHPMKDHPRLSTKAAPQQKSSNLDPTWGTHDGGEWNYKTSEQKQALKQYIKAKRSVLQIRSRKTHSDERPTFVTESRHL